MKVKELEDMLEIMPEEAEVTGMRIFPEGNDEATGRRRYSFHIYSTLNGVSMRAEGAFLSLSKAQDKDKSQPLTHRPFAALPLGHTQEPECS